MAFYLGLVTNGDCCMHNIWHLTVSIGCTPVCLACRHYRPIQVAEPSEVLQLLDPPFLPYLPQVARRPRLGAPAAHQTARS